MKKAVKEVVKTVKAVKVEVKESKVDRRSFNPGRPKSKEAQDQDEFVYNLTKGQVFTVDGLDGEFNLTLYDIQGRLATSLFNGFLSAGYYEAIWDGSSALVR